MEALSAELPQLPRKVLIPALAKVDERGRTSPVVVYDRTQASQAHPRRVVRAGDSADSLRPVPI
jgi:hypothetical protein